MAWAGDFMDRPWGEPPGPGWTDRGYTQGGLQLVTGGPILVDWEFDYDPRQLWLLGTRRRTYRLSDGGFLPGGYRLAGVEAGIKDIRAWGRRIKRLNEDGRELARIGARLSVALPLRGLLSESRKRRKGKR